MTMLPMRPQKLVTVKTSLERSENKGQIDHLQSYFDYNAENSVNISPVHSEIIWLQGGPLK